MLIELSECDLSEEFRQVHTDDVSYSHFKEDVKKAIRLAGSATFRRNRGEVTEQIQEIWPGRVIQKKKATSRR